MTFSNKSKIIGAIVALIVVLVVLQAAALKIGADQQAAKEANERQRSAVIAKRISDKNAANKDEYLAKAEGLVNENKFEDAAKYVAAYTADKDPRVVAVLGKIDAFNRKAEIARALQLIKDGNAGAAEHVFYPRFVNDPSPEVKATYSKIAAALKKERADDQRRLLAARKRDGVQIGMTKEQVLQSSWGRPQSVNRTAYSFGTKEQWVYPGAHNYLYFDDDKLTAIQN